MTDLPSRLTAADVYDEVLNSPTLRNLLQEAAEEIESLNMANSFLSADNALAILTISRLTKERDEAEADTRRIYLIQTNAAEDADRRGFERARDADARKLEDMAARQLDKDWSNAHLSAADIIRAIPYTTDADAMIAERNRKP